MDQRKNHILKQNEKKRGEYGESRPSKLSRFKSMNIDWRQQCAYELIWVNILLHIFHVHTHFIEFIHIDIEKRLDCRNALIENHIISCSVPFRSIFLHFILWNVTQLLWYNQFVINIQGHGHGQFYHTSLSTERCVRSVMMK